MQETVIIICSACSKAPFGVMSTGVFRCDNCGAEITIPDLVLDPGEVWTVDSIGTLGYIVTA